MLSFESWFTYRICEAWNSHPLKVCCSLLWESSSKLRLFLIVGSLCLSKLPLIVILWLYCAMLWFHRLRFLHFVVSCINSSKMMIVSAFSLLMVWWLLILRFRRGKFFLSLWLNYVSSCTTRLLILSSFLERLQDVLLPKHHRLDFAYFDY